MRTHAAPSLLCALFLAPIAAEAAEAFALDPGTRVLPPIAFRQLAVFPVVQSGAAPTDKTQFLTLADGLEKKLVAVSELGSGGQVNRVRVENKSDRPLLLLGGEVILGGQQDRILGKDTIVPAKQAAAMEVYCVEHGRWSGAREFTKTGGLADQKLRVRAKSRGDQGQVWQEVAAKNAALGAATGNSTGTYRKLAAGDEGKKAIQPYRDFYSAALAKLSEAPKMIGLIAAVNGRVTSVDLFGKPELFASYRDHLLDSYFMSVADVAVPKVPVAAPAAAEIRSFLSDADAAKPEAVLDSAASVTTAKKGKRVVGSTLEQKASGKEPAAPVYKSYQSDE